ncbi:2Fe-2S iron-sulfur cluster-binding domain protein [Bacteriovorax sp. Seq25_V]|nr:2Fe-2S iron-sulfur cluster-binding domain protein [Bacteriovorax sp. Seq25_V]
MPTVSVVEIDEQGNEISNSEKKFTVETGDIIYDAIDNQGCQLPHGCLAGSCGSCRILIIEGSDNVAGKSVIEGNTISNIVKDYQDQNPNHFTVGKEVRLSCRARLNGNGDVKIAALKK